MGNFHANDVPVQRTLYACAGCGRTIGLWTTHRAPADGEPLCHDCFVVETRDDVLIQSVSHTTQDEE